MVSSIYEEPTRSWRGWGRGRATWAQIFLFPCPLIHVPARCLLAPASLALFLIGKNHAIYFHFSRFLQHLDRDFRPLFLPFSYTTLVYIYPVPPPLLSLPASNQSATLTLNWN